MAQIRGACRVAIPCILSLLVVVLNAGEVLAQATLTNGGFESPLVGGSVVPFQAFSSEIWAFDEADVPGWSTTDINNAIEIWQDGALDLATGTTVSGFEGGQFAEINAFSDGTLSTVVTPTLGSIIGFEFAHRGRLSDTVADIIQVDVFDLGADGIPGGGDDLSLMSEQFSATNVAWNFHPRPLGISTGNPLLLEFAAIFSAGGSLGAGNFLDAVGFGENVPEPGTFALLMLGAGVCCRRRRRA